MIKQEVEKSINVLFTGGGTGGHLYPAIALAEELKRRQELGEIKILFIGSERGLEAQVLPNLGYTLKKIWIRGWQRGWKVRDIALNLLFPIRLIVSFLQSWWYIRNFKPDLAIGTGGYTAGPPLRIAALKKIPIYLHEQNVFPGATTRLLAKHARRVYISFKESEKFLPDALWYGTPLRQSLRQVEKSQALLFFELASNRRTILIFGGSQGAHAINQYWAEHLAELLAQSPCQVIWQTGQREYESLSNMFLDNPLVHITPFIHDMGIAYSAADLIVSRAGAISLAEICLYGKPAVLIPLPTAAGNHQEINARSLEKNGAAVVVLQKELNTNRLLEVIKELLADEARLAQMSQQALSLAQRDAAPKIIDDIIGASGFNA